MRQRTAIVAVCATVLLSSGAQNAQSAGSNFCALPEVLELVEAHYAKASVHLTLVPTSATELRTDQGRVVCAVLVNVRLLNEPAGGPDEMDLREQRTYQLRPVTTGVEIDFGGR